jgi:ethanolamine-phosphate cytidylyltransferase
MSEGDQESCYCSSIGGFFLFCESLVLKWSESSFISWLVATISKSLHFFGVPEYVEPSPLDTCRAVIAIGWTLFLYYILFGSRHRRRRMRLAKELQLAKEKLHYLQEKLREPSSDQDENGNEKNEIRIFMDGAFDLMHYGHMNAFRLGKSLGTHLVVAINSDVSITKCKGAPLMNDEERISMVEACKFVDEVVPDCPYIMNKEYLDYVIDKYKIDYVIHGDDPCIVDGKDVYATAKKLGKYRSIPRTEGVSTTDIVGRMLLLNKAHHLQEKSKFLTTSRMLQLFSANVKATSTDMRVIYIDGAWDLFHPGHAAILNTARKVRWDVIL